MPTLDWIGKAKVINHHLDVPYRVLDRQYSYDMWGQHDYDNDSPNMIVHGDNLEALKALLPQYGGRVDLVYIDPPYNTGNEGWVYNDNLKDPRTAKWLGEVVGKEGEDFTRHDKWLCMMYPRLKLLHKLLAPEGVIFISIDDNELYNLKAICDEIFGANCFVADISWQRTYSTRNDAKGIVVEVEHLLVYSKSSDWQPNKLARTAEMDSIYKNPDNDVEEWASDNPFAPGAATHQGMVYAIQHPFTGEMIYPTSGRCWTFGQDQMLEIMNGWCAYELKQLDDAPKRAQVCGVSVNEVRSDVLAIVLSDSAEKSRELAQQVYKRGQWPRFYFTSGGTGGIRRKTYLSSVGGTPPTNLWEYVQAGHTDEAAKELKAMFNGTSPFDTPKPTRLVELILRVGGNKNALVLDSFAGSGTTGHAVLKLNKEDGGNRRFILAELMDYADSITAERVKRAIDGYEDVHDEKVVLYEEKLTTTALRKGAELMAKAKQIKDDAKASGQYTRVGNPKIATIQTGKKSDPYVQVEATITHEDSISGLGGSFSYYELGEPLFIDGAFNPAMPTSCVNEYLWYAETNLPYTPNMNWCSAYLGTNAGVAYYSFYDPNAEITLDFELLGTIDVPAERYVVYANRCIISQESLDNCRVVFKKIPRDVIRA